MQPHYRDPLPLGDPDGLPYSKAVLERALVAAGVEIESAYILASSLELELIATGARAVEPERLREVGSSRVDLQACKLEYSIVSPK